MTRVIGLLLVGLVAIGCSGQQSADRSATPNAGARSARNAPDEVVRRVEDVYRKQTRLTARFRQRVVNKVFGLPSVNDGKVYLKKPDKMRWDYFSRRHRHRVTRTILSNGTTVRAIDINGKWYYTQSLARSALPVAVSFMTGTRDLSKQFNARLLTASKHGATGDRVVELTPKKPSATLKSLVLVVDPSDFRVKRSIVTSATGDTNEFTFYSQDTRRTVADTWFVLDPKAANARGFHPIQFTGAPPQSP